MKTSIEFQLEKLSEKDLKDDSLINIHIRCDHGVREKLIVSHNDLVLSCYMNWNQGSFDLKLNKKELIQILNKKRFDEINSEDLTDFLSDIEIDLTKDGELDVQSLNGVEKTEDQINILNESGDYNFKIDKENIDDVLSEIYSDGDIDESDYEFIYGLNVSNIKINNEILFNSDVLLEYEGTAVAFILFIHCFFTKAQGLENTKSIIGNSIMKVVNDDDLYQKCWEEGYQIYKNNSAKVDSGDGWGDYFDLIQKLNPDLERIDKNIISDAIIEINKYNEENSNDYDKAKVCNLISNIDFSRDSWGDIVNDSSNVIKLELTFIGGKKDLLNTPEHVYDSDMLTSLNNSFETEVYCKNGNFGNSELKFFLKINIHSKLNPIFKWLKDCFKETDEFYFEDENEAGSRVLLNYGVLNFDIINKKEKKSIISSTSSISDLIFDEYDLKWFEV